MFSAKFIFLRTIQAIISRLVSGSKLLSLDYIDKNSGLPFVEIVSKQQETFGLDIIDINSGKIFSGTKL